MSTEWVVVSELDTSIFTRAIFEGYEMTGRYPIGGDPANPVYYKESAKIWCIYCGQEYREVEYRWSGRKQVGCSCCGAPKG